MEEEGEVPSAQSSGNDHRRAALLVHQALYVALEGLEASPCSHVGQRGLPEYICEQDTGDVLAAQESTQENAHRVS